MLSFTELCTASQANLIGDKVDTKRPEFGKDRQELRELPPHGA